jgi:hypothetical protein
MRVETGLGSTEYKVVAQAARTMTGSPRIHDSVAVTTKDRLGLLIDPAETERELLSVNTLPG